MYKFGLRFHEKEKNVALRTTGPPGGAAQRKKKTTHNLDVGFFFHDSALLYTRTLSLYVGVVVKQLLAVL